MNPKLPLDGRTYTLTVGSVPTTNVSQINVCQILFIATLKVRLDLCLSLLLEWTVTPWMVPPQNRSSWTVRSRINGPPEPNIAAIPGSPPLPRMVPSLSWRSERVLRLSSKPGRMKLTLRSALPIGYRFTGRVKGWHLVYSCTCGSKLWTPRSGGAFSYSRSIPRQVVESRVEPVLWQENGRVHWWRRNIITERSEAC